ncbi:MAG: hypothetical protein AB1646_03360 [Thermodesulfobacteriota bacterium]
MRPTRFFGRPPFRVRDRCRVVCAAVIVALFCDCPPLMSQPAAEILGVRMGMPITELRDVFGKAQVSLDPQGPREFAAAQMPQPLEGVREARLTVGDKGLEKVVLSFDLPPQEPTASNLIARYNKEKERLISLFGSPSMDVAEMKAPTEQERHQWLARGMAYYQASWLVKDQLKISLWIYAEDAGLVFTEIYEGVPPR